MDFQRRPTVIPSDMNTAPDNTPSSSLGSMRRSFAIYAILVAVLIALSTWLGMTVANTTQTAGILAAQGEELKSGQAWIVKGSAELIAATKTLEVSVRKLADQELDMKEVLRRLETAPGSLGQSKRIAEAVRMAEEAERKGDKNLAVTFLVNALQREPANLEITKRYVETVISAGDAGMLSGAQRILEQLLFQASPADVPQVAVFLEQVVKAGAKTPTPEAWAQEKPLNQRLDDLMAAPLELESSTLAERLENLLLLQEELAEADPPTPEQTKKLDDAIERVRTCAKARQILDAVKLRFDNLEEAGRLLKKTNDEQSRTYALASLQAAELAVNEIWMIKHSLLPTELADEMRHLPAHLKQMAAEVQDEAEKPSVAEAKHIYDALDRGANSGGYASRLQEFGRTLEDCTDRASKVQGGKAKAEFRALLQAIASRMDSLRKEQFAAYQKWAVEETDKSRKKLEEENVATEADVEIALSASNMQMINFQLLSPEVAQFVQDVLASMLAECGAKKKAEVQRRFAIGEPKKKLEDF